jgi:Cu+-exporting ATPase
VSHIQDILSALEPAPHSISPSLVSSWVTVEHETRLSARKIHEALEDAGFDVCDVTPDDSSAKSRPAHEETGYLDRLVARWQLGKQKKTSINHSSERLANNRHVENCEACRLELGQHKKGTVAENSEETRLPLVLVESNDIEDTWRASVAIGGMTCAACVSAISEELGKKGWVKNVAVNLISNSATIDFVGEHHKDEIVESIEDIGYDASIDTVVDFKELEKVTSRSGSRSVEILVEGMFCGHCPPRALAALKNFGDRILVEKALTLDDPILRISYTPSIPSLTIRSIIAALSEVESLKASIYHPPTLEERSRKIHARERLRIFIRVVATLIVAIPTFIIGIVYMSLVPSSNSGRQFLLKPLQAGVSRAQWALFVLATPVYFMCADVFHIRAMKEVRTMWRSNSTTPMLQRFYRFGSMNMLMSLGTSIAYISSIAQLIAAGARHSAMVDDGVFYFDSVVFLTFFLLTGRLIEAYSKSKTGDAVLMLGKLRPSEALLVQDTDSDNSTRGEIIAGQSVTKINVDLLEYGDIVKVLHGGSPPCDGIIVQGETTFDESSLTGESRLIKKTVADEVFSGTVNKDAPISIRIIGVAGSSMLDQIVRAVREGQTRRAPMERIADTLTGYFVPFVTLIAITTWIVWLALGYSGSLPESYMGEGQESWVAWSLQFAIAVFVVACPCGLALAAPTALFVGGGLAAKYGILVKGGGEAFEKASRLDCVVFDKTGTLTLGGEPSVTDFEIVDAGEEGGDEKAILGMVKAIEGNSSHTVAKALLSFCEGNAAPGGDFSEIPGYGIRGSFRDGAVTMIIGNEALMVDNGISIPEDTNAILESWKAKGRSVALTATKSLDASYILTAIFAIADPIRPEAPAVIKALRERGTSVWMLSGDNQTTANAIGAEVGIPSENIIAGVLPSQKSEHIRRLQQSIAGPEGKRALVAMVGDGINDSPALTTADVGIAIGSGSDIAISSAEFVLINANLQSLLTLLDLSKTVFRRIKFNFAWALVYNMIALPVSAGVLYPIVSNGKHVRLDPVWASLAMAASSISVVCSSLALRSRVLGVGFRPRKWEE